MTKRERKKLAEAIAHLEANPCEWEDAMSGLCLLAGIEYRDPRKVSGTPVTLAEIMTGNAPNAEIRGGEAVPLD